MEVNPIPCIIILAKTVNEKKEELENLSNELYKMSQDLVQYIGKEVTVVYKIGMTAYGQDVTQTITGILSSISKTGQNFVVKTDMPGIKNGNVRVKVLDLISMTVK